MFLNLLLLIILVFDSTFTKTPIPSTNQNSLEDPNFDDVKEKFVELEFRSEKPTHPNGKSIKGHSNGDEIKKPSEIEFLTLDDSERNEKADRESTKKGNFNVGNEFLCNTTESTENRLIEDSVVHPCHKKSEEFLLNSPEALNLYEFGSGLTRKSELNSFVDSDDVNLNDSIIEPDIEGRNNESKNGKKSKMERPLKYMNGSVEKTGSDLVENPVTSLPTKPLEKALGKSLSKKELTFKESGLDSDGPVADGRILTKHHASHERNNYPVKETPESAATHHDSMEKVYRIDKLVINQQSKVIKTIKSKGGSKNYESRRKPDDSSTLNVSPNTIIFSETTLLRKNVPPKDADVTGINAVKEHDSMGKGNVSDARGNSHEKSNVIGKDPSNSRLVPISEKNETDTRTLQDGNFPIEDSKDASHTRKSKLDKSRIKHSTVLRDVRLSRNERIPESDRGHSHRKSKTFHQDPWNLKLDHDLGKAEANTGDNDDGNFPIVNSHGSRDVSYSMKHHPEDEVPSIHLSVQNNVKHSRIPEDDTRENSHKKSKISNKDPLNLRLDYVSGKGDADVNAHKNGVHSPFVDSKGSKDVSRARKNKQAESPLHKEVKHPNNEQITKDDKNTSLTHLEPTQESLSDSLKVLFFNQSLYEEVLHLVKTDRNVQAYIFNVLLLYIPVLICDLLLWLVIFKLLCHIHRQFVSNRLNSAPTVPEKKEVETKLDSFPGEPLNPTNEALSDSRNLETNAPAEGAWYPPK